MNKKIVELLYRSFDDKLTPAEQQRLDQALSDSKELREEKIRIAQMRTVISDSGQRSFQPFFAEKVMRRIREAKRTQESFFDSLIEVFRPVAIAATILFIVLLAYNLFKSDNKSLASALAEPEITLEQSLDPTLALVVE
jgi:anti-sigma factor RsiW